MVNEDFRRNLRVLRVADQVDSLLISAYVPQLRLYLAPKLRSMDIVNKNLHHHRPISKIRRYPVV